MIYVGSMESYVFKAAIAECNFKGILLHLTVSRWNIMVGLLGSVYLADTDGSRDTLTVYRGNPVEGNIVASISGYRSKDPLIVLLHLMALSLSVALSPSVSLPLAPAPAPSPILGQSLLNVPCSFLPSVIA